MRLADAQTSNLNARLLVLGGSRKVQDAIFEDDHPRSYDLEAQRDLLDRFLSRDLANPSRRLPRTTVQQFFPDYLDRVPSSNHSHDGQVDVELLGCGKALVGATERGAVYVWNVKKVK